MKKKASPFNAVAIAAALLLTVFITSCQKDSQVVPDSAKTQSATTATVPPTTPKVWTNANSVSLETDKKCLSELFAKFAPFVKIDSVTVTNNILKVYYRNRYGTVVAFHGKIKENGNVSFFQTRTNIGNPIPKIKEDGTTYTDVPTANADAGSTTFLVFPTTPHGSTIIVKAELYQNFNWLGYILIATDTKDVPY